MLQPIEPLAEKETVAEATAASPRMAVEALAAGSYEAAARIYAQLARDTEAPVYRLAATLAKRKIRALTPP